ncbi:phosphatidylserine decarboxylase proenzyme 1, mitochondrial [Magnolia sinica]|uniref:phosphatidylserine decarboxylase proenzyme 1, mitochondrial n=1 Tax=Magnolia sinica TaxID=86752 RepID=UPI00265A17B5|nr:phosphatidylserine decarboxylase proenzyme 1, mitochondrial [Magnolia sinica]
MKFRASPPKWLIFPRHFHLRHLPFRQPSSYPPAKSFCTSRASVNGGASSSSSGSEGNSFLVPGATMATILMLGILHARRIYDDKKVEEAREKGVEFEFSPDTKAAFLGLLPLRSISRLWGFVTSTEIPIWLRPYIYKGWARAFHSNLDETALPLEEYASLRDFFSHALKEGSRPIDSDPFCLVSPVDGTVLRFGELKEPGGMIEQVKGFSYSASSLLGANSFIPMVVQEDMHGEHSEQKHVSKDSSKRSWWRISLASPKVRDPISMGPVKGVFYCVIYLKPGDYHRVHSPADLHIFIRRHFSGRLFPQNERATRTIRNLYVENERVVLEGQWSEGFMALAAIGATNVGSIELSIEPELRTNRPKRRLLHSDPPDERIYEPEGIGVVLKKGDEVAAFNMGSTVVLVFQAPVLKSTEEDGSAAEFKFCIRNGDRIRMGEALGRWRAS